MTATLAASKRAPAGVASVAEGDLRRAAERLTAETGLTFPGGRRASLARALATASEEVGIRDIGAFLDEIDRKPQLLERLAGLVTIGETYFFRHPQQLDVLSREILPALIAGGADPGQAALRIWCAGCSTGEEAYSLAILAHEALGDHPGQEFRVVATDIDREALRRAEAASYSRWAFRAELGPRAQWFEADGARRRVRPGIADRVTFDADNLSLEGATAPAGLGGPPNLILCRNVTMYLSDGARKRVAGRFFDALVPGGWLLVAPVEVSSSVYAAFDAVVIDGLTFYRRPTREALDRRAADESARRAGPRHKAPSATPSGREHPGRSRPQPLRTPRRDPPDRLTVARRLADQGSLAEARRESELLVREDPHGVRGYLLLASVADAQDDLPAAAAALRRAVYIDRADAATQFRLGLLEWRTGRKRPARARLTTALALVAGRGEAELLDEASDLTVGRLRSTVGLLADD